MVEAALVRDMLIRQLIAKERAKGVRSTRATGHKTELDLSLTLNLTEEVLCPYGPKVITFSWMK